MEEYGESKEDVRSGEVQVGSLVRNRVWGAGGLPWKLRAKAPHLPVKETEVRSLVWEDPTCHVSRLQSLCSGALEWHRLKLALPRAYAGPQEKSLQPETCSRQVEGSPALHNEGKVCTAPKTQHRQNKERKKRNYLKKRKKERNTESGGHPWWSSG